ncbi:KR domain-containing protein [Methylobacterium currus]|jgi:NAD(P)-dependent dehydrogenase (short-subunit alcohol dehydrogenase family)|uniref:KR domain-containing protein n=1 Tax=Methylobacterium currus TaxID=2051553 RepID=A0A2R4WKR2_9HYPH|nr:SDR family NAD(P)-dependent oxidoreductase [Methylobacterium currus]AWB22129.1 KR domain-containing protein [Methylobacterium currus]UHC18246.1 SDR family NAD(P)-dependent oxidoreductase [Methylobacterium currus]
MGSAVVVGASGGIGRALVAALAAGGAHETVFALSRSPMPQPGPARSLPADVTDEDSIAAAARTVGESGPVDLVVVASGILHGPGVSPEKAIRTLDPAAMATVMAVNAIGPALVAKHVLPLMPRRGRRVFAALSARVGSIGDNRLGGWYAYRASKAALNQILRTLAVETARTHPELIVAGLHPGTVQTALSRPFRPDPGPGLFAPEESAAHLVRVLNGLQIGDSGRVFAWDGQPIPP